MADVPVNPARRGPGAPCGPKNGAWRHGKFSRATVEARRKAAAERMAAEREQSARWLARLPAAKAERATIERLRRARRALGWDG